VGDVPAELKRCFRGATSALRSHRGVDRGALALARVLARACRAPLRAGTTSRLVVDLNRSLHHRGLFSEWTRELGAEERESLLDRYYRPYRSAVQADVAAAIAGGDRALHVSVHSFTPVWHGEERRLDVGLLYDPRRRGERALCARWRQVLAERAPGLVVRRNQPYLGRADGLTTALRRRFGPSRYLGVELELNQRHVSADGRPDPVVARALAESLRIVSGSGR